MKLFLCYFLSVAQKQSTKQQEAAIYFNVSSWSPVTILNIVRITSVTFLQRMMDLLTKRLFICGNQVKAHSFSKTRKTTPTESLAQNKKK